MKKNLVVVGHEVKYHDSGYNFSIMLKFNVVNRFFDFEKV